MFVFVLPLDPVAKQVVCVSKLFGRAPQMASCALPRSSQDDQGGHTLHPVDLLLP